MAIDYTPTTELEAVNAILAASNESPVIGLDSTRPDVAMAQAALAAALKETMASRWRFNSDINYRLAGTPQSGRYVYPEPAGLLAFTVTPTEAQRGLDLVARASRTYLPADASVRIITNRIGGLDTLSQPEVFINPVWAVPFALAPEAARRFIVRSAIRRRVAQSGYPQDQVQAAAADEQAALAALTDAETASAQPISGTGWANELDALNTILATAGKPGIADVLESEGVSLVALSMLRQAVIDTCSMGWRFNTEIGYGITPLNLVYNWTDVDGSVTPVLIYAAPDRLLDATPSVTSAQEGTHAIDPIITLSERYRDLSAEPVRVLYDRQNHRDGFPAGERTVLWLDVTWRKPFSEMPESARHFATVLAGRRLCATMGATPRWSQEDESTALRMLQRAEGKRDVHNIFTDNPGVRATRGRSRRYLG